eukprot:2961043-Prymnesium_polylepis.1
MAPPRTLMGGGSPGQFMVDVGLGEGAEETRAALMNGFTVLSFEPMPANFYRIRRTYQRDPFLHDKVKFIEMQRAGHSGWVLPRLDPPPPLGSGPRAHVILAGLGANDSTVELPTGFGSAMSAVRGRRRRLQSMQPVQSAQSVQAAQSVQPVQS